MIRSMKIFLAVVFTAISAGLYAQMDMTIYPLSSIPQSYYDNPSVMPDCKLHIGCFPVLFVPILSSNYTSISNSGFKYDDIIHRRKSNDSLYLDPTDMIKSMSKKNHLIFNQYIEWASFGFKFDQNKYINFSFTEKLTGRFTFPRDLFSMMWQGNAQFIGSYADLTGTGIDITHYREIAFGYTQQIDEKWTVGGRLKLLFGNANIWTKKSKAQLYVHEDYYDLTGNANVIVYASAPQKIFDLLNDAIKDTNSNIDFNRSDVSDYFFNFDNPGFGLDVAATYIINKDFTVSASVVDFGYIFWKTAARKYYTDESVYTFRGIDVNDFIRYDSTRFGDVARAIADSLLEAFDFQEEQTSYASPLNPKIFLSAFYNISPKDKVYAIFRTDIYENTIHPNFSLAYTRKFGNILDFSVSYSYMNRNWLNLGIGSSGRFGPFQIFLATDNILAPIIPYHTKNINIHFGCNYVFYQKKSSPLYQF